MLGTYGDALTAQTTFVEVDICHIVFNSDGTEGALLLTLPASDTTHATSLHGYRTFVLVNA